jgi:hypothetical protein
MAEISIVTASGAVTIDIEFDGSAPRLPERVVDRVEAAGGSVDLMAATERSAAGRHRIRAMLPCE